jgi:hypothetical protein
LIFGMPVSILLLVNNHHKINEKHRSPGAAVSRGTHWEQQQQQQRRAHSKRRQIGIGSPNVDRQSGRQLSYVIMIFYAPRSFRWDLEFISLSHCITKRSAFVISFSLLY